MTTQIPYSGGYPSEFYQHDYTAGPQKTPRKGLGMKLDGFQSDNVFHKIPTNQRIYRIHSPNLTPEAQKIAEKHKEQLKGWPFDCKKTK